MILLELLAVWIGFIGVAVTGILDSLVAFLGLS